MQLQYNNEYFQIDNNVSAINGIFEIINKALENKSIVFSHLIIDGIEVYENHEEYIKNHLNDIAKIEIATRNAKDMIWETMESIHEYLKRVIPALMELVDEGYERFTSKSWEGVNQLAEGMQWILKFRTVTNAAPQQPANWDKVIVSSRQCEKGFEQLLEAIEVKDTILISDILSYEVTPAYESLKQALSEALKDEEYIKNVN